ncbi:hypothetical protein SOP95_31530, partial [Pseudomonas sp. YuFO8]|nr:hypothetical protein [Pseudomonas sp. YuFO8]
GSFHCPGSVSASINQRLNRSTNEYCVFADLVSSSLSSAEFCACSEVWSASAAWLVATNHDVKSLKVSGFTHAQDLAVAANQVAEFLR